MCTYVQQARFFSTKELDMLLDNSLARGNFEEIKIVKNVLKICLFLMKNGQYSKSPATLSPCVLY